MDNLADAESLNTDEGDKKGWPSNMSLSDNELLQIFAWIIGQTPVCIYKNISVHYRDKKDDDKDDKVFFF